MSKSDQYDLVFARCGNMSQSAAANPRAFEMARAFEMVELPASKWRRLMLQAPIARGNCKVRSSGPGVASNANLTFVIFRQAAKTMHRSGLSRMHCPSFQVTSEGCRLQTNVRIPNLNNGSIVRGSSGRDLMSLSSRRCSRSSTESRR